MKEVISYGLDLARNGSGSLCWVGIDASGKTGRSRAWNSLPNQMSVSLPGVFATTLEWAS